MTFPRDRRSWLLAGAAALIGGFAPAAALAQAAPQAQAQPGGFAIAAQPLGDALVAFGRQSGWQVAVDPAPRRCPARCRPRPRSAACSTAPG